MRKIQNILDIKHQRADREELHRRCSFDKQQIWLENHCTQPSSGERDLMMMILFHKTGDYLFKVLIWLPQVVINLNINLWLPMWTKASDFGLYFILSCWEGDEANNCWRCWISAKDTATVLPGVRVSIPVSFWVLLHGGHIARNLSMMRDVTSALGIVALVWPELPAQDERRATLLSGLYYGWAAQLQSGYHKTCRY